MRHDITDITLFYAENLISLILLSRLEKDMEYDTVASTFDLHERRAL